MVLWRELFVGYRRGLGNGWEDDFDLTQFLRAGRDKVEKCGCRSSACPTDKKWLSGGCDWWNVTRWSWGPQLSIELMNLILGDQQ